MKTSCVRVLLLALALALLPGCKSVKVYTTRAADMHEAKAPQLATFAAAEQPAVVVDLPKHCAWGRRVGTVWVEEAISGRAVWHQSQFMRNGSRYYFVPEREGLQRGTFIVTLRAAGEPDPDLATAWRTLRTSIATLRGEGRPVAVRILDVQ
jgi:hypothetical protein